MKNLILGLTLIGLVFSSIGCTDTDRASMFAYGSEHDVKLYSCGSVVGEWTSTGVIQNEDHSDGFLFKDLKSGKLIEISGEVIITQR